MVRSVSQLGVDSSLRLVENRRPPPRISRASAASVNVELSRPVNGNVGCILANATLEPSRVAFSTTTDPSGYRVEIVTFGPTSGESRLGFNENAPSASVTTVWSQTRRSAVKPRAFGCFDSDSAAAGVRT